MKIREDFVTNSSSSSFIIARYKDCTREDVEKVFLPEKKDIITFIIQNREYLDLPYELDEAAKKKKRKLVWELMIEEIADKLLSKSFWAEKEATLEDWALFAGRCSNESDELLENILYEFEGGFADNDSLKIR